MILSLVPRPCPASDPIFLFRLAADRHPPRVALIEDDLVIATMYRLQLETDGYEVVHATDGATGLHLVQQSVPDLILLDIRLPQVPGLDVLRSISADPRLAGVPVLILSNYGEPSIIREGMQLGAREYLVKSQTTPVQLSERLRAYLPPAIG